MQYTHSVTYTSVHTNTDTCTPLTLAHMKHQNIYKYYIHIYACT